MCLDSITPSPCQAHSRSTTSPRQQHLSLSASARLDVHSEYGTFFSPRVSALAHAGRWTSRLSVGTGFFGPTPITEETEAAGLTRLEVRQPVEAERGLSASFDVSRTDGPLSYTATLFASRINDPLHVERSPSYVLSTLPDPTTNVGLELLGTLRKEPFSVTATYTYVRARETVDAIEQDVPLTPRHSAGIVGMWEAEDVGRVGIEWYYTGRQSLEENPYRAVSEPYMILGLLAEKQFGRIRLFVNGENLTGVRQTRWDPLLRPTRAVGRPMDRRCVGAARRPQHQRRPAGPLVEHFHFGVAVRPGFLGLGSLSMPRSRESPRSHVPRRCERSRSLRYSGQGTTNDPGRTKNEGTKRQGRRALRRVLQKQESATVEHPV